MESIFAFYPFIWYIMGDMVHIDNNLCG